jgi:DNA-binding LytR/AlgR family response regulator
MRTSEIANEPRASAVVQPVRDETLGRRDEPRGSVPKGHALAASGGRRTRAVFAGIAALVATACLVNALSVNYDLTRVGRAHKLWEPFVWEATSAILVIALLALPRRAAELAADIGQRPLAAGLAVVALASAFSAAHVTGMVLLRTLVYAGLGAHYSFDWSVGEFVYELRKDAFAFLLIAVMFWLAERAIDPSARRSWPRQRRADEGAAGEPETRSDQLWLRDGRNSLLVDVREILWVGSAGNYVEYVMASGLRHLIRATLRDEEMRLSPLGFARIHRSRLVNMRRIVAIGWRPSGDFDLRLDTAATVAGSRRYRAAVARLGR